MDSGVSPFQGLEGVYVMSLGEQGYVVRVLRRPRPIRYSPA